LKWSQRQTHQVEENLRPSPKVFGGVQTALARSNNRNQRGRHEIEIREQGWIWESVKSKNKDNPNSPDYYGSVRLTGINYKIGAWKKQSSKTGETFLSLTVQPESEGTKKPDFNDSLDF